MRVVTSPFSFRDRGGFYDVIASAYWITPDGLGPLIKLYTLCGRDSPLGLR